MAAKRGRTITTFGMLFNPLGLSGGVTAMLAPTPAERIVAVLAELRALVIGAERRTSAVEHEDRVYGVK